MKTKKFLPVMVLAALAFMALPVSAEHVSFGFSVGGPGFYAGGYRGGYGYGGFGFGFVAPPPPVAPAPVYYYPPAPGYGYIWIDGYWYPYGGRYVWRPGYWARPPWAGAYWVRPRYYGGRYYHGYWARR